SIDPENGQAENLINKAGAKELQLVAQIENVPDASDVPPPPMPPAAGINPLQDREQPLGTSSIENYEALVRAKGQRLQRQVEIDIENAYQLLASGLPEQAESALDL